MLTVPPTPQADGSWLWIYTWSDGTDEAQIRLRGTPLTAQRVASDLGFRYSTSDPGEIIAGVDNGVYVARLGGGQVNTATGDFVFGMTEAYLIEGGEITEPLRDGNLIGNGPKVLRDIDMLGNDFAMGSPGTCGKDGQGVPVGDGVPTLRAHGLTIGGTAA